MRKLKRKLFKSDDYTFCIGEGCDRKEDCMRYIKLYPHLEYYSRINNCSGDQLFIDNREQYNADRN